MKKGLRAFLLYAGLLEVCCVSTFTALEREFELGFGNLATLLFMSKVIKVGIRKMFHRFFLVNAASLQVTSFPLPPPSRQRGSIDSFCELALVYQTL